MSILVRLTDIRHAAKILSGRKDLLFVRSVMLFRLRCFIVPALPGSRQASGTEFRSCTVAEFARIQSLPEFLRIQLRSFF